MCFKASYYDARWCQLHFGLLQVLKIDGSHRETLLRHVRLLQTAKQHQRALEYAKRAVAVHADDYELNLLHAEGLRYASQCQSLPPHAQFLPGHGPKLFHSGWQYWLLWSPVDAIVHCILL